MAIASSPSMMNATPQCDPRAETSRSAKPSAVEKPACTMPKQVDAQAGGTRDITIGKISTGPKGRKKMVAIRIARRLPKLWHAACSMMRAPTRAKTPPSISGRSQWSETSPAMKTPETR
eukprot:540170-Prymnesium_polylepis.3